MKLRSPLVVLGVLAASVLTASLAEARPYHHHHHYYHHHRHYHHR